MKETIETYHCDKCGKELPISDSNLNIMTSKYEGSSWARLHVKIEYRHGFHNDAETDPADLCKKCAVELLQDALRRVKKGERATKGTETSEQEGWTDK